MPDATTLGLNGWWQTHRREIGLAVLAAAVAGAGAALVLRLWNADMGVPFRGSGDALFFQMLVKDALESGWILTNPHLGAPFGQELYDYPVAGADVLQVLGIKFLGLFISSPAAVFNTYFLLTFPAAAIAAYAVLRWLGVSAAVAIAGAVLFALAPYHFLRSEYHYFLAATLPVPLGAYLVLAIYRGTPLFDRFATPRTLGTLAVCVAVGLSDFYYAAFTALLAAAATLVAFAVQRQSRTLVAGAAVTLAVVVATGVALAPSLVYRAEHGSNEALTRAPSESELYSLNMIGLVMPVEQHRIGPLAELRARYQRSTSVGQEPAPLGLLGAIGFVWLLAVALALCIGAGGRTVSDPRQRSLATANLTALLLGTTGGVSAIIAYAVGPELRTWSRLSIFIAFFAVAALCLLADSVRQRLESRGGRARAFGAAALAAVVLLAVVDGTSPPMTPAYSQVASDWHSDDAFVAGIERTAGPTASIVQLPYTEFPDQREFARLQDYDALRGYLHSSDLRWSHGAMKGRPRDWQSETVNTPPVLLVPMMAAAGFQGIYLDRFGYPDHGRSVESQLRRLLDVAPFVSPNRRLAFYDLRPYSRRLRAERPRSELDALGAVTVRPVQTLWSSDYFNREERNGLDWKRWTAHEHAQIDLVNPSSTPRVVVLSTTLARPDGSPAQVRVTYPDGTQQRLQVDQGGTRVLHNMRVPPGQSEIDIDVVGAPVAEAAGQNSPGFVELSQFRMLPSEALGPAGLKGDLTALVKALD